MSDGKTAFATVLVIGFLILTGLGYFIPIPPDNVKTLDGAMVALGTALGAAVMALLRNTKSDDIARENTGKAFDAIAASSTPPPAPPPIVPLNLTDAEIER
jgi:hypothetical protein